MRIVLDTNVLISGIFFTGPPSRILEAWVDGRFELIASVDVLAEYRRVCERLQGQFPSADVHRILDLVIRESRIVGPATVPPSACSDPDDLKFLACALAGRAGCVVTGDRALLKSSGFRGIEVVTPREFLRRYMGG
jgi:putative PIN family toxin of toxin-antitoxin system